MFESTVFENTMFESTLFESTMFESTMFFLDFGKSSPFYITLNRTRL
jgi:hypothetical protein